MDLIRITNAEKGIREGKHVNKILGLVGMVLSLYESMFDGSRSFV